MSHELWARADEVATDLVRRVFERTESVFRAVIEQGQRSGEISPGRDSAGLAAMLQNTVVGLRLAVRVVEGPDRLARIIDADGLPLTIGAPLGASGP